MSTTQISKSMEVDLSMKTISLPNTYTDEEILSLCQWFGYEILEDVVKIPKTTLWYRFHKLFDNNREFDEYDEHKHLIVNEDLVSDLLIDFCQPSLMSIYDANKHKRVIRAYCIGVYRNMRTGEIRGFVFRGLENSHKVEFLILKALENDKGIKVVECDARYHKAIMRHGLTPKYVGKTRWVKVGKKWHRKPYLTEIEQPLGIFQKVIQNNAQKVKSFGDLESLLNGICKVVYEKNAKEFLRVIQQYHNITTTTKEENVKVECVVVKA